MSSSSANHYTEIQYCKYNHLLNDNRYRDLLCFGHLLLSVSPHGFTSMRPIVGLPGVAGCLNPSR
ncbi:hypothetical protein KOSB73_70109 [Klebsiella grimontii]|uniref:Uncharacterized protein n=1 Tax=Klebsiella grimontii TaxID=2058152 RepID=A0A285BB45_9ENTR|nr:hypothetical protein KOSB73_70109 [Klebsiella grimontii]